MKRALRLALALGLAGPLLFLLGARCVEHDALRRGPDGNWHIYGELFNDTDVQGTGIVVQGSLFDASGELLATGTAPTCPGELSPGKPVVYDIRLPNTEFLPEPSSYRVNVAKGVVLEAPLPELAIAPEFTVEVVAGNKLRIGAEFLTSAQHPGRYEFCVAFYDGAGDVMAVLVNALGPTGPSGPSGPRRFAGEISRTDIPGAVSMRVWIYAFVDGNISPFQPFVTLPIRLPPEKKIPGKVQIGF
jgi:hypothetical protein